MIVQKLCRAYISVQQLGYYRTGKTISHRIRGWFALRMFLYKPTAWSALQRLGFAYRRVLLFEPSPADTALIARANRYAHNCVAPLGAQEQCFATIPWYCDIRLAQQNPSADYLFDQATIGQQYSIDVHMAKGLGKDIKIPWELARCTHIPVLARAYHYTKNHAYAQAAQDQITSWLDATTYGHGIHWINGMEVAIRAVNWIIALQWLAEPLSKNEIFFQRLLCSLYDHMRYLEHHWEWYDGRTNNHYVANIVGYAYLCWFFKNLPGMQKKWKWCYQELKNELAWQVFEEGTSYEGSTKYHRFVTELFVHGFFIAHTMGAIIPQGVREKLERMLFFIEQCIPHGSKDAISIGDDDSGYLLDEQVIALTDIYSLLSLTTSVPGNVQKYYSFFGISLYKDTRWHVSLRHHAYTPRQPTGHFHHDVGSVTIAYDGVPIIVDPGTYVYTASLQWRNYFRSREIHNTMYAAETISSASLFTMPFHMPRSPDTTFMKASILFPMGMIERTVTIEDTAVYIRDYCSFKQPQRITWHFTFAPQVQLQQHGEGWQILRNQQPLLTYLSSLSWCVYTGWFSPHYGEMVPTTCLRAVSEVTTTTMEHTFRLLLADLQ